MPLIWTKESDNKTEPYTGLRWEAISLVCLMIILLVIFPMIVSVLQGQ